MADRFRQTLRSQRAIIATNEGKKQYVRADGSFHQTREIPGEASEQMRRAVYRPHYAERNRTSVRQGWV